MKAAIFAVAVLAFALGFGGEAMARHGVALVNYENVPIVRVDNAILTTARVRQAIVRAIQRSKWMITEDAPGLIVANLMVRGKHSLTVEIRHSATEYSILYRDSSNLNYAMGQGGPVIHPTYNKHVLVLLNAINADLRSA